MIEGKLEKIDGILKHLSQELDIQDWPKVERLSQNLKLSIITICYNEHNVEATCNSVVSQTFKNFEWIVVDGGSEQKCLDMLYTFQDRMSYFVSEPDKGRYDAMNKGILRAQGEYLLFLNAGDKLNSSNTLSSVFEYKDHDILQSPNLRADILYGEVVAEETNMMPWPCWPLGPQSLDNTYFRHHSLPHQATFIKKILFDKIGLYNTEYKSAGDLEWFVRAILLNSASSAYIPIVVSVYNFNGISSRDSNLPIIEAERIKAQYLNSDENNIGRRYAISAYKLLFDRFPESEEVINGLSKQSKYEFFSKIIESSEFKMKCLGLTD